MLTSASPIATAQVGQPDIIQEHWYHTYATLTLDLNEWADNNPEIVNLLSVGQTEMGRNLWMLQISDWSQDTKPNGEIKEVVYIDGGHHGNEHLGTELAFLTAEYYIEGWADGNQDVIEILETTELHILIMLNADGNDLDTRWNINQVDLNRNPWGKWPQQPSDWEMFHFIRDDVNSNISEIPIQNANQGLYPNCGTSRDYGYGVMGYPTFTFETDDEQFLLGTVEALSDRLGEELDVMKYLIENIWYWRARLVIEDLKIGNSLLEAYVVNLGQASTSNATFHYSDKNGELLWHSETFGVNATNESIVILDSNNLSLVDDGVWSIHYQKRVIDSAQWVDEPINNSVIKITTSNEGFLPAPSLLINLITLITAALASRKKKNILDKNSNIPFSE